MEQSLLQTVHVESIGSDQFVGRDLLVLNKNFRRAISGQILAQALSSAAKTVEDPKFLLQSVHCHYIRPVNSDSEVIYHVARLKDGRSISIRGVRATQGDKTVFSCLVSLSAEEKEDIGLTHTDRVMPQVHPIPQSETESVAVDQVSQYSIAHIPLNVAFSDKDSSDRIEARLYTWFRTKQTMTQASQNTHRVALSFASDMDMPWPVFYKYSTTHANLVYASLDHSIWFHENVDFNQWHLSAIECVRSVHGLPVTMSRIYNQSGTMVATVVQQSLARSKL